MNRTYGVWSGGASSGGGGGGVGPGGGFAHSGRSNWKGKKKSGRKGKGIVIAPLPIHVAGNQYGQPAGNMVGTIPLSGNMYNPAAGNMYQPPALQELQATNRLKARRFYPKRNNYKYSRFAPFAPFAPRNTTSFIIRAKKSGGITSLVSPCPVTPAILPTPVFSPTHEGLIDMAKEEWGVDGYGSMNGLIRLRSPGNEENRDENSSSESESDVEEHIEVERRLDHDLSRFEMIYPLSAGELPHYEDALESRVNDQDAHIAQLEEENLTLKERLFLMEQEMAELRRRLSSLETGNPEAPIQEDVSENDGGGDVCSEKSVGDERSVGDVEVENVEQGAEESRLTVAEGAVEGEVERVVMGEEGDEMETELSCASN